MSEEGFQPKGGGKIEIVDPKDRGLPRDLRFTAMSNKTLADEIRKLSINYPFNSDGFGALYEAYERLKSYG